jgi:HEAT repeat protein
MNRLIPKLCAAALLLGASAVRPLAAAPPFVADEAGRSEAYRAGQRALAEERWADAAREFRALAAAGGAEADAALYWQAYAEAKRQHKKEALEALRALRAGHPASAWLDDAEALELELRGGAHAAEVVADDELKLYAVDALMQMDAEKAIPVLERILAGDQPAAVKERALFVLGQSDSPRAREILIRTARSAGPLELRAQAVQALGIAGEEADVAALAAISRDASAPPELRAKVLEAYLIAGREAELAAAARTDPDPRLRVKAIELLGAMDAEEALRALWATEKDPEVREKLLQSFGIAGDVATLALAARDEDPRIRRKAIEGLAISDSPESARELERLYGATSDLADKQKVLEAFMIQDDAETLIRLFRAEKDPALKKKIVQQLALLDDPSATELLLGLIEGKP